MKKLLSPYADMRTYRIFLYLLLGLPLGVIEFTVVVTGLSLGIGLAITIIGIPLFVGVLILSRYVASMERELARSLLDARIPRIGRTDGNETGGWLSRAWNTVKSGGTWMEVTYLLLRLPVGVLDFTVAVTIVGLIVAGPAQSIVVAAGAKSNLGSWTIDTFTESLWFWPISVTFVLVGPRLMLAWSGVSRRLSSSMLGRVSRSEMKFAVAQVLDRLGEADGFSILDELALRLGDGSYLTPTRVEATLLALESTGYVAERQVRERKVYTLRKDIRAKHLPVVN